MTISIEQLLLIGGGAVSIISTLAVTIYRELKAQISDRDKRIAAYEAEAVKALAAKDTEISEWRRIAQQQAETRR